MNLHLLIIKSIPKFTLAKYYDASKNFTSARFIDIKINLKRSLKRPNIILKKGNNIGTMEILTFTMGVILGVIITLIGFKSGASVYNKAVTDMTQPPEFEEDDRTPDISNYDYGEYNTYYKELQDDESN